MAATSLSVARLLQLRIPIAWQEAVAVASAADALSAADGLPITLEHCCVTTAGEVHLSPPGSGQRALSSLQLLEVLLQGRASTGDLRALVLTADDGPSGSGAAENPGRLHLDLHWCLGANPCADVAGLAARGLSADSPAGAEPPRAAPVASPSDRTLVRGRSRVPFERVRTRRQARTVTVRVLRLSPGAMLGMAAILLAVATGAAATLMFADSWPWMPPTPSGVAGVERAIDMSRPASQVRPISSASH